MKITNPVILRFDNYFSFLIYETVKTIFLKSGHSFGKLKNMFVFRLNDNFIFNINKAPFAINFHGSIAIMKIFSAFILNRYNHFAKLINISKLATLFNSSYSTIEWENLLSRN